MGFCCKAPSSSSTARAGSRSAPTSSNSRRSENFLFAQCISETSQTWTTRPQTCRAEATSLLVPFHTRDNSPSCPWCEHGRDRPPACIAPQPQLIFLDSPVAAPKQKSEVAHGISIATLDSTPHLSHGDRSVARPSSRRSISEEFPASHKVHRLILLAASRNAEWPGFLNGEVKTVLYHTKEEWYVFMDVQMIIEVVGKVTAPLRRSVCGMLEH